ncbi:MAG: 2-phospho-L-lactate guanylyltransferase [Chloroflexi bacterium]|nr:2-phospho-L-lactate guanylyltransferase [Chloroflexota bacterium]
MSSSFIFQPSALTYAIIPVKPLRQAKSRLARTLKPPTRAALVRAIFSRTLDKLAQVDRIAGTIVVSRDLTILELARQRSNVIALAEAESGLNLAITQGAQWALTHACGALLIVPVDLPLITVADLDAMLDLATDPRCLVIAPDRHTDGTNLMLVRPPDALQFAYGSASFNAHRAQAVERGLHVHIYRSATSGLDLDVPDDLALYHEGAALLDGRVLSE